MILQALNRYYDILLEDQEIEIAEFGYSVAKVSFALILSPQGELLDLLPFFTKVQKGKKSKELPYQEMVVPAQVKKTSGINANFLCENSAYVLGISDKSSQYSFDRFKAFRKWNIELLSQADSEPARAVIAFLQSYSPDKLQEYPVIIDNIEKIIEGRNLVFMLNNKFVHEDKVIQAVWNKHKSESGEYVGQCLVTGEVAPIARLHSNLKGVRWTQSSGATLVGFNARAYESYNRTKAQGLNSPVSEKATFAYTTALNYLLSDANPNKKLFIGDTTIVYWAESENRVYESAFASFVDPAGLEQDTSVGRKNAETALQTVADKIQRAQMMDLDALLDELGDENPRFYILGLSPNAARVSVRFFVADPFRKIVQNIMAHYHDLAIVKEYEDQPAYLSVWRILNETVSKKSRDKNAAPLLAGAVFRAILTNTQYPAALYYAIINRIRADMDDKEKKITKINYIRAAIIKAFLTRKFRYQPVNPFKEVLTMALNEQSTNPAYLLGRLFFVLEDVQAQAIGKVNAGIKDRYFTSACASPGSVFPILLRLSQHHIAKAEYGKNSEWRIQKILNLLDIENNPIPTRLTLDEQGVFILGYYHQRAFRYKSQDNGKDDKAESEVNN